MGRFLMRIWGAIALLLIVGMPIAAGFERDWNPIQSFFAAFFYRWAC
jgi:hypothetical protein